MNHAARGDDTELSRNSGDGPAGDSFAQALVKTHERTAPQKNVGATLVVARPATAAESSQGELCTDGVTWTEEGPHKGCPYGDSKSRLDPLRTHVFAGRQAGIPPL